MSRLSICFRSAALGALMASCAFGVDGVILIDQNRALAGNVTPGDAPGFPVTISQAGSYRLSGNLTNSAANGPAIQISASSVTLDLNGFKVECLYANVSAFPWSCIGSDGPFLDFSNIEIRNGIVSIFTPTPPNGLTLGLAIAFTGSRGVSLEHLRIDGGNGSFSVGAYSIAKNVIVRSTPNLGCPSLIIDSTNLSTGAGSTGSGCVRVNTLGLWP